MGSSRALRPWEQVSVFRLTPAEPGVYAVSAHASSGLESANLMSGEVTVAHPAGVRLTGVSCDRGKAVPGESITWTAQAEGAAGEVAYSFALYRDWALTGLYETGASPAFSFAPEEVGTYSVVACAKDDVRSASAHSADVRAVSAALTVDSVTADQLTGAVGTPITRTVDASGGDHLQYMYFVYFLNKVVYASPATAHNRLTYTTTDATECGRMAEGARGDAEQTASFQAQRSRREEGRPRVVGSFAIGRPRLRARRSLDGAVDGGNWTAICWRARVSAVLGGAGKSPSTEPSGRMKPPIPISLSSRANICCGCTSTPAAGATTSTRPSSAWARPC